MEDMTHRVSMEFEADLVITVYPRCPTCFERDGIETPNPNGNYVCERCGEWQPAPMVRAVPAQVMFARGDQNA